MLPTAVVGSHAKPGWWHLLLSAQRDGVAGPRDVQEGLDDATTAVLEDLRVAGIDVWSDGEVRRHRGFARTFHDRLTNVEQVPPERLLGAAGADTRITFRATGPLAAPDGLGIVDELRRLKARTDHPIMIPVPGALTLARTVGLGGGYSHPEQIVRDLIPILNAELRTLASEGGMAFIQIDEPASVPSGEYLAAVFNEVIAGVDVPVALHVCFGSYLGRPAYPRSYAPLFPGLAGARPHHFVLEFANRELAELDRMGGWLGEHSLGVGVVDTKSYYLETPNEVAARIRRALAVLPAEQLWLNPDCGFNDVARDLCRGKLHALAAGTRLVRAELGLL